MASNICVVGQMIMYIKLKGCNEDNTLTSWFMRQVECENAFLFLHSFLSSGCPPKWNLQKCMKKAVLKTAKPFFTDI